MIKHIDSVSTGIIDRERTAFMSQHGFDPIDAGVALNNAETGGRFYSVMKEESRNQIGLINDFSKRLAGQLIRAETNSGLRREAVRLARESG